MEALFLALPPKAGDPRRKGQDETRYTVPIKSFTSFENEGSKHGKKLALQMNREPKNPDPFQGSETEPRENVQGNFSQGEISGVFTKSRS